MTLLPQVATDYYVIYDTTTGLELIRGAGSPGCIEQQVLAEGTGIAQVPQSALLAPSLDLAPIKLYYRNIVDQKADEIFKLFATGITGQDRRYLLKQQEALAWTSGDEVTHPEKYPFMIAEATVRSTLLGTTVTVAQVRSEIIAQVTQSTAPEAVVEAYRVAHKLAINAATTIGGIVSAANVDWNAILTPYM